jgi:hypothetical protein
MVDVGSFNALSVVVIDKGRILKLLSLVIQHPNVPHLPNDLLVQGGD